MTTADGRWCDLVLAGGGVKGLGTAGAVMDLLDAGWTFPRVAGTSVGALAAAFAAARAIPPRSRRSSAGWT
jgi:NTE family protein